MLRILISFVLLIGVSSAVPIANVYSGTVYINGVAAPSGAMITASVDGIKLPYGSTANQEGRYNLQITGETGQSIKFYINENLADQTDIISRNENDTFDPFVTKSLDLSVTIKNNPGTGNGGGGGGGGGGISGERFSNIEIKEKYDLHIYKDKVTSFVFTNKSNPILFVNITGNVNAGEINTAVEVLRSNSTLVKSLAPGTVYKNVNIWVGTSGFATSNNIKEAIVVFRVENSWFDSNAIARGDTKLVRWDGAKWITLETSEKTRDSTYTYFEGKTTHFSPFAITGLKAASVSSTSPSVATPALTTQAGTPEAAATTGGTTPQINLFLIIGVILILGIISAVYLKYKK